MRRRLKISIKGILIIAAVFTLSNTLTYSKTKPVHVEEIRYRSGANYTRVVIGLSGKASYTYRLLNEDPAIKKPRRFYVDIKDAQLKNDKNSIDINDGLLKMARAGQFSKDTVRVVLDIETISDYKIFPLTNPYRIVVDVMGERYGAAAKGTQGAEKKDGKETKDSAAVKTIIIDAGHGGKDPGAIGKKGLEEKDVTLKLAKLLKQELSGRHSSNVILTREKDVFIPLDERTAIANAKEADLFVSIHVNASFNRKAGGVETYYLGNTKDRDAIMVAARENSATEGEMNDVLEFILKDLQRSGNQKESIMLATSVQDGLSSALNRKYGIKSNGVKGALFYVLVNCNMPSILVEVSFVSNPKEEKLLRDETYLKEITGAIADGILRYINGGGAPSATLNNAASITSELFVSKAVPGA